MENKEIRITYRRFEDKEALPEADRDLFEKAVEVARNAYAPYSRFSVGAAVKLVNGSVVAGSNQENIAYPSGLCAERVAIFSAASTYPGIGIESIAVAAQPLSDHSRNEISPCGACRQVMMEYERILDNPIKIISGSQNGPIAVFENARSLLPLAFFDAGLTKEDPSL